MKSSISRRDFGKHTAAGLAAGVTILRNAKSAKGAPANEKVILAGVGVRGRGQHLLRGFLERSDCEYGYLCDVNEEILPSRAELAADLQGTTPKCVQDFRNALDDASVDAIVVATPDHWHALATVWGCQAGKDVYVEKPASHSCWEGKKMVEAARLYKRVVQVGMQNRSAPYNIEAKKLIENGGLGRIHLCRVFNMKYQPNFEWAPQTPAPAELNWDMWQGPAPAKPFNQRIFSSGWHHLWDYSGGDLGNDGVHQIDLARWLCGLELPKSVFCHGGRFDEEGVAESPDTQIATLEYDDLIMTFELTLYTPYMLKTDGELRQSDMFPHWPQNATRIEIYGSDAMMVMGRHGGGWQVFVRPKSRKPVAKAQMYGRFPDPEHKENFIRCVKSRELPNADVEIGHRSAALVHYANISHRLGGQKIVIDPDSEDIVDNLEAMALYRRTYRTPWVIEDQV